MQPSPQAPIFISIPLTSIGLANFFLLSVFCVQNDAWKSDFYMLNSAFQKFIDKWEDAYIVTMFNALTKLSPCITGETNRISFALEKTQTMIAHHLGKLASV